MTLVLWFCPHFDLCTSEIPSLRPTWPEATLKLRWCLQFLSVCGSQAERERERLLTPVFQLPRPLLHISASQPQSNFRDFISNQLIFLSINSVWLLSCGSGRAEHPGFTSHHYVRDVRCRVSALQKLPPVNTDILERLSLQCLGTVTSQSDQANRWYSKRITLWQGMVNVSEGPGSTFNEHHRETQDWAWGQRIYSLTCLIKN